MLALSRRYPNKRAFITGAASGLGKALALQLATDGWKLWLSDMRADALQDAVAEANAKGATAVGLTLNVTDRARYQEVAHQVLQEAGGAIDVLINNAGVAASGNVGKLALEDWDWLLSINLTGVLNGCHFFVESFRQARSGHIINISSAASIAPVPTMSAYCVAKAGVKMLSEVMVSELHGDNVHVSVVMPEFFQTNLGDRTRGTEVELARHMLGKSRYTADHVAIHVLKQAGKRNLHILFPARTVAGWWLLRAMPQGALGLLRRVSNLERRAFEKKQAKKAG